jgi:hypothetical protein
MLYAAPPGCSLRRCCLRKPCAMASISEQREVRTAVLCTNSVSVSAVAENTSPAGLLNAQSRTHSKYISTGITNNFARKDMTS